MSRSRRTSDALVGLLVISCVAVVLVALSVTQGWNDRRFVLYMRSSSALQVDTKVMLQGLEIGEVASVSPLDDPSMGPISFIVSLRIRERYANGVPLRLPVGTRGEIDASGLIGNAFVSLQIPPARPGGAPQLMPGDTITSSRAQTSLESLSQVADSLKDQVSLVLADTRTLINRLTVVADQANRQLASTAPEVRRSMQEVQQTLAELRPVLAQASSFMVSTDARFGTLHDSLVVTLAQTRQMIEDFDSLTVTATGLTRRSEADIQRTLSNMYVVSAKLEHFLDQVSRRPLRMITGVRPLSSDSLRSRP